MTRRCVSWERCQLCCLRLKTRPLSSDENRRLFENHIAMAVEERMREVNVTKCNACS